MQAGAWRRRVSVSRLDIREIISRTHCKNCGQKGHWARECPRAATGATASSSGGRDSARRAPAVYKGARAEAYVIGSEGELPNARGKAIAVVDTACTGAGVGLQILSDIRKRLEAVCENFPVQKHHQPFAGVGGIEISKEVAFIPVGSGGRAFWIRAAVLHHAPKVPLLLSRATLEHLGLDVQFSKGVLSDPKGWEVPLERTRKGTLQ